MSAVPLVPAGLQLRPATREDLAAIWEIERASFSTPWPKEYLEQQLGEGFVVLERAGQIAGYAVIGIKIPSFFARLEQRTRALFSHTPLPEPPTVAHLLNIAVAPAFRRQGLGRFLLQYALDYAHQLGASRIELEVRTDNSAAIALYRKFGFHVQEIVPNYYSDGADAYLMVKALQPAEAPPHPPEYPDRTA
ncbi:MAG: ribosomal protein S18-alanine N-acetyltransferase [Candidatus Bipolaricaulota bacterium]|nr:ribosomal protein S18-alanine N-acetyltransferase [Candidatus Bipolaricaulota bacterium]MCS7275122.1 ribosomal protein S18-alanine N-acetyltransferase [Candidatus Bipolaricaulota bacterium]MDW8111196.1 ribosomal protein S18-alanine N-acetyltransferase [Candidatus Bipolaricaulota bacterium]MDW8329942.1 ribosomal protein S18-alanine N-acetyltransferase [Candidatus Bipolaricaulota bacterium]